jgi:Spy/CpxP family protein refolding chaperone
MKSGRRDGIRCGQAAEGKHPMQIRKALSLIIVTAALGALTLSSAAYAQKPGAPTAGGGAAKGAKQRKPNAMEKAIQELGLNEAQKAQIKDLLKKATEEKQALKADAKLTPEQKKAKAREIDKKMRAAAQTVLTPEQQAKWKEMQAKMKAEQKEKAKAKAAAGGATKPGSAGTAKKP